jgi:hypothetical protein
MQYPNGLQLVSVGPLMRREYVVLDAKGPQFKKLPA